MLAILLKITYNIAHLSPLNSKNRTTIHYTNQRRIKIKEDYKEKTQASNIN